MCLPTQAFARMKLSASYRAVGVDLQKEVHEDMVRRLFAYPLRGLHADSNIDHRRVPNLQKFFEPNTAARWQSRAMPVITSREILSLGA